MKILILLSLVGLGFGQSCSYETNIDYFGNDLSNYPTFTRSIDECCRLCSGTPSCAAWTFLPSTGACWLKYAVGSRRYMSDGRYSGVRQNISPSYPTTYLPTVGPVVTTTTSSQTFSTASAYVPVTTVASSTASTSTKVSGCFIETDVNYVGNDLKGFGNVPTASDCCNLCGSTQGCQAWSYYVEYSYCYLKNNLSGSKDNYPGMLSGVVKV